MEVRRVAMSGASVVTCVLFGLLADSCGPSGLQPDGKGPSGSVQQGLGNGITATPSTCMPDVGASQCTTTINWTEASPNSTYQIAVRSSGSSGGATPWSLFACIPPNNPTRSSPAGWIVPHRTYVFSLRRINGSGSCASLDPSAQEVAVTSAEGATATMQASSPLFVSNSLSSVTLTWAAKYNLPSVAPYAGSYAIWARADDQVDANGVPMYSHIDCLNDTTQGVSGSTVFTQIAPGHRYRFSLNLHPGTCSTFAGSCANNPPTNCIPDGPEIAATTVNAVSSYIRATTNSGLPDVLTQAPTLCSAASGGTCTVGLNWRTSASGQPQIWEYDGTSWTELCPPALNPVRTLTSGLTYTYELHMPSVCGALRTDTPAVATATAKAVSGFIVRDGLTMKLDGAVFPGAVGMTKMDLWVPYYTKPDGSLLGCSEPDSLSAEYVDPNTGPARTAMAEAVARQVYYMRFNATTWGNLTLDFLNEWRQEQGYCSAGTCVGWPHPGQQCTTDGECRDDYWNCPDVYWRRFNNLVSDAAGLGMKLILHLPAADCRFADHYNESISSMLTNPGSQSQQELFKWMQDLLAGCSSLPGGCGSRVVNVNGYRNNSTIQLLDLSSELNYWADSGTQCAHVDDPVRIVTTDDTVKFKREFGAFVRGFDSNHLISTGDAAPATNAAHHRAWPPFPWVPALPGPCWNGADLEQAWCPDDQNMFESVMRYMHPDPYDVVSIHLGPSGNLDNNASTWDPMTTQFGFAGPMNGDILSAYQRAADALGKPLYNADFGPDVVCDGRLNCVPCDTTRPFSVAVMKKVAELHIPLSTQWAWEHASPEASCGLTPGADSAYLDVFQSLSDALTSSTRSMDLVPANADFEFDSNSDGTPDGWTKCTNPSTGCTGTSFVVTSPTAAFDKKAVQLAPSTDAQGYVASAPIAIGSSLPAGAQIVAIVGALTDAAVGSASMVLYGYSNADGTGTSTQLLAIPVTGNAGAFKVFAGKGALPPTTRSIVATLVASGGGYVQFDAARISALYN